MRKSSRESKQDIQCVEVLVSRNYVREDNKNLFWTLSVYSLQNQPVKTSRASNNSEVFHFMVYDWKRSLKKMLDEQQVPYSVVEYFSPDSIHADDPKRHVSTEVAHHRSAPHESERSTVIEPRTQGNQQRTKMTEEVPQLVDEP